MSKLTFNVEKKSYLVKSLSYLFIGILLYLFIFYRISAPGSNPYFSSWTVPHNSFYLGMAVMAIIIFVTMFTSIKYRHRKTSMYISRAVSFSMFQSPLMTIFITPLMGFVFLGNGNVNEWVKVSLSITAILVFLLRLNITIWRGKSDDNKIISKGNNSQRVTIVLLVSSFVLLIAIAAQEMKSGLGTANPLTYKYMFWISSSIMSIQYIRYFWKIFWNEHESHYLKVIDPTLPTVALVGIISYVILVPINSEVHWYGTMLQTHFVGSIMMLTAMITTLVFGVFIKYLIYLFINSRPRILSLLESMNYKNVRPWSVPVLTSLMILWNIFVEPKNPEEIPAKDNKLIKRVKIFRKDWYKGKTNNKKSD